LALDPLNPPPYPPDQPLVPELQPYPYEAPPRPVRQRFRNRTRVHVILFAATILTTTGAGASHYGAFLSNLGAVTVSLPLSSLLLSGLWYSLTLLAILGAHEMGHYLMCRYHNVDASLPYFLPAPLLTGTIGAFIRIREAFPTRAVLFDIGVAGPLAGFAVLVPALFIGLWMSNVVPMPSDFEGWQLGEPLLFQWAARLVWGAIPGGHSLNMHPMVFAAWFGLFATALNLLPFGQLDGGHISYAVLGRRSTAISVATVVVAVGLTYRSTSWLLLTAMLIVMMIIFGPRHPRVLNEYEPLTGARKALALTALLVFVVCFTPVPIEPYDLIVGP
jgi:membrane-associated protease RseP (regulator of RpoE activity)